MNNEKLTIDNYLSLNCRYSIALTLIFFKKEEDALFLNNLINNSLCVVRSGTVLQKGGVPATPSGTATLLRLHPSHQPCLRRPPPRTVGVTTSGKTNSHGVTGGVYKARERIHPSMLTWNY